MKTDFFYADLQRWLQSDQLDYAAGLALVLRAGIAATSLTYTVLSRGADAYTRKKLAVVLTNALAATGAIPVVRPVLAPVAAPVPAAKTTSAVPDQAVLARLYDERTECKANLRAWLDDDSKGEARRVLALRIKAITAQIDGLFHPEPPPPLPPPPNLLNVRSSVSRYRKKVREAATDADRSAVQAKLQALETTLSQLTNATI